MLVSMGSNEIKNHKPILMQINNTMNHMSVLMWINPTKNCMLVSMWIDEIKNHKPIHSNANQQYYESHVCFNVNQPD
jgi:hypothetical protein